MKHIIYFIVIGTIMNLTSLQAQWIQTNGPYGGGITTLTLSDSYVFAGTMNGVFKSSEHVFDWEPAGLKNKHITSLASFGENIFAAVYTEYDPSEVYLSTDNGLNWELVSSGLYNSSVSSLVVSGTNLIASTLNGLFITSDKGKNWIKKMNNLPSFSIFALAATENNILISSYENGIFITSDNGEHWSSLGLKNYGVSSMAMIGDYILAGTYDEGVFLSTNKGSSWDKVDGLKGHYIHSLKVNGNNFIAFSDSYLFASTDNGVSWTKQFVNAGIRVLSFTQDFILAGTNTQGILLSTDNGKTWTRKNNGLNSTSVQSLTVNGEKIYAGTAGGGFFISTDKGSSWIQRNASLTGGYVWINSIAVKENVIYTATNQLEYAPYTAGVYISTNEGISWTKVKEGRALSLFSHGNNVFAGMSFGLWITNDGMNWTQLNFSKAHPNISSFAAIGDKIFAGTYYHNNGGGVFLSEDNGTTWVPVNNGLTDSNVFSLTVNGNNIFAGTQSGGVYYSSNNGTNWRLVNEGLPNSTVLSLASQGTNVFAAGIEGVYLSTDNGNTWTNFSDGLPKLGVSELSIDNNFIFAATNGAGVWMRSIDDILSKNEDTFLPSDYILSQNFPNPFNPYTTIQYQVPELSFVNLKVYDVLGKELIELVNELRPAGIYEVSLDASQFASGIYYYKIQAAKFSATRKMVLIK